MAQEDYEFLWDLLEERDELLRAHPDVLPRGYTAGDAERARWHKRLGDVATDPLNPLPQAVAFWRANAPADGGERLLALDMTLRQLDDAYRAIVPRNIVVRAGLLVLGRVLWLRQVQAHARRRDRPAHSGGGGYPLRHLRRVRAVPAAWIEVPDEAFAPVVRDGQLRIALCGLGAGAPVFGPTTVAAPVGTDAGPTQRFAAGAVESLVGADPLQELRGAVSWAAERGAHVLCFPELCVTPQGVTAVSAELAKKSSTLALVVAGSFHTDSAARRANTATVLLRVAGKWEQLTYHKFDPVRLSVNVAKKLPQMATAVKAAVDHGCATLEEDLVPGTEPLLLNTAVGTFGVLICKDCISHQSPVHQATVATADQLLIPSMNFNPTTEFDARMQSLAREHYTASYYLNSAWAAKGSPDNAPPVQVVLPFAAAERHPDLQSVAYLRPGVPLPAAGTAHRLVFRNADASYNTLITLPLEDL